MANQEKSEHLSLKKAFKQQEKEKFVTSLPIQVNDFLDLFEDLDHKLVNTSCNHT
jgi:hypothetical protein